MFHLPRFNHHCIHISIMTDFVLFFSFLPLITSPLLSIAPHLFIPYQTNKKKSLGSLQQAVLFRLTGDTNPYLVDPSLAEKFGYRHPPMHGICSLGIVAHKLQVRYLSI